VDDDLLAMKSALSSLMHASMEWIVAPRNHHGPKDDIPLGR
jgi:hypothetical protein